MLDKRGTGLSDRVREVQSLETSMDDIRAVMDAVGSERAVLWSGGNAHGYRGALRGDVPGALCRSRPLRPEDHGDPLTRLPVGHDRRRMARSSSADIRARWGARSYFEELAREWAPEVADDPAFVDWFVWHMRRSLSPGAALTAYPNRDGARRPRCPRGGARADPHPAAARPAGARALHGSTDSGCRGRSSCPRFAASTRGSMTRLTGRPWTPLRASSRASEPAGRPSGSSPRSCSRTSSARRSWPHGSATRRGASCWSAITRSSVASLPGSMAVSSTRRGTGSLRPSTGPLAPSRPPPLSASRSGRSGSRSGPVSIPASSR